MLSRSLRYASRTRARICLPTRSSSRKSLIATHSRRISAPLSLITSCRRILVSNDVDIFRPAFLDPFLRQDRVAERLRHLPPVDVDQEPVRQHLPERRPPTRAQTDQQRALEPAAVLIAASQVDVRRPRQPPAERQPRLVARTRVEPHVEDVALALELGPAARRASQSRRNELFERPL